MELGTQQGGSSNGASKGLAGTALGLAIPGTVALANQLLGGGLTSGLTGGLLGGWGRSGIVDGSMAAGAVAIGDTRRISDLESQLAREKAERYADGIGIEVYKEAIALSNKNDEKMSSNFKEVIQGFIAQNEINATKFAALDKEVALNKQASEYNFAILNNKIDCCCDKMRLYVDGTFVPGKLVMPKDSICPEVMSRYNSWTAPTATETA